MLRDLYAAQKFVQGDSCGYHHRTSQAHAHDCAFQMSCACANTAMAPTCAYTCVCVYVVHECLIRRHLAPYTVQYTVDKIFNQRSHITSNSNDTANTTARPCCRQTVAVCCSAYASVMLKIHSRSALIARCQFLSDFEPSPSTMLRCRQTRFN